MSGSPVRAGGVERGLPNGGLWNCITKSRRELGRKHSNPSAVLPSNLLQCQGAREPVVQSVWVSLPGHKAGWRRVEHGSPEEVAWHTKKTSING